MELLTSSAMTVLGIQWLLPAQLILHFSTMTAGFVASVEVCIIFVDLIRRSMLPLVELPLSVSSIAILAVSCVCRCLCHVPVAGVELDLAQTSDGSKCWLEGMCRGAELSLSRYCSVDSEESRGHISSIIPARETCP
jgi:hypothetical protein